MSCEHPREDLGGYVLDALEPDEREALAAHLAECPLCAAELERLAGLPALIAHAEGLEIPAAPAAVEERLLDQLARERGQRRQRRRRRPVLALTRGRTLVATALAGAALGAGVTALALSGGDAATTPPVRYGLVLTGAGGASGRAALEPGRGGTQVHMWVKGLPPGGDSVYEVRCEGAGWSASAGTFRADTRGRAYVVLTTAARLGEYERIRVVRRPDTSQTVLTGELD
jgi:anti-sigma factor RsiW